MFKVEKTGQYMWDLEGEGVSDGASGWERQAAVDQADKLRHRDFF